MRNKKPKSPQAKKALSYAKDRRNTHGENSKASRKLIPLRRAQESRQDRRKVAQELSRLPQLNEEAAAVVESSARHDMHRVGGWRKVADVALGKILSWAAVGRPKRGQ